MAPASWFRTALARKELRNWRACLLFPYRWLRPDRTAAFGAHWQKAVADLERLSGGRLPKQNPAVVARTIRVGKSNLSKKRYCGG